MFNLAPWYYKELFGENNLIETPEYFKIKLINNHEVFESVVTLKVGLRPEWVSNSIIYKNCDGSGASDFKNIAVYKAISEALERLAFYETMESDRVKFSFDVNPTTTGLAAFPYFNHSKARINAKAEAVERWALHEFNKCKIPVKKHITNIKNLEHYELITPFTEVKVSLLIYASENFYSYGFAGGRDLQHSFLRSLIELDRNYRVLQKSYLLDNRLNDCDAAVDRTLLYFSQEIGFQKFCELIKSAPQKINYNKPTVLCDMPIPGHWDKYTKIWRYLLDDSYFPYHKDHTFFMF